MSNVRRIEWTYHTSSQEGSGTDSQVRVEIYRDGNLLANVSDEPGETARLDRGEVATRGWSFENPTGLGTAISGTPVPYTESFPNGVGGHLRVRFRITGDDAWRIGTIESTVFSGRMEHVAGTIDSFEWVESPQHFSFAGLDVLSTNPAESGSSTLMLNY